MNVAVHEDLGQSFDLPDNLYPTRLLEHLGLPR